MKIFIQRFAILTALLCGFLLFSQAPAQAQIFSGAKKEACKGANLSNSQGCDQDTVKEANSTIENAIEFIVNLLSAIVGVAAVIMIIINGMRFITANGDSSSITSARNGVIYAIVGLIVVAFAQIIVRFVIQRV